MQFLCSGKTKRGVECEAEATKTRASDGKYYCFRHNPDTPYSPPKTEVADLLTHIDTLARERDLLKAVENLPATDAAAYWLGASKNEDHSEDMRRFCLKEAFNHVNNAAFATKEKAESLERELAELRARVEEGEPMIEGVWPLFDDEGATSKISLHVGSESKVPLDAEGKETA